MLREDPELTGIGRPQFEAGPVEVDHPRSAMASRAAPATVAIEAQVRCPPRAAIASFAEGARRGTINHSIPEPFEARAAADVEEDMVMHPCIIGHGEDGSRPEAFTRS
jgi:hypothetical protein